MGTAIHNAKLHQFVGQESYRPFRATCRRIRASGCDQHGRGVSVELAWLWPACFPFEGSVRSQLDPTFSQPIEGRRPTTERLGNLLVLPASPVLAFIDFQQNIGLLDPERGVLAVASQVLQITPFLTR